MEQRLAIGGNNPPSEMEILNRDWKVMLKRKN